MYRVREGGVVVAVEVWAVLPAGLASVLLAEPPCITIGKVRLASGAEMPGVLAEPILSEGSARSASAAAGAPTAL